MMLGKGTFPWRRYREPGPSVSLLPPRYLDTPTFLSLPRLPQAQSNRTKPWADTSKTRNQKKPFVLVSQASVDVTVLENLTGHIPPAHISAFSWAEPLPAAMPHSDERF